MSVCAHTRQQSDPYTVKQTLLKEFQGSFQIWLCEIARAWTSDWFHVPIWLFSVPLSAVMSSKRVPTLRQDLTGFTVKQSPLCWLNAGEDNDNDDGGYRGVITVHGGFRAVWMSKTPKRERLEEGMRKKHWRGGGVGELCLLMCRLIEVRKVLS